MRRCSSSGARCTLRQTASNGATLLPSDGWSAARPCVTPSATDHTRGTVPPSDVLPTRQRGLRRPGWLPSVGSGGGRCPSGACKRSPLFFTRLPYSATAGTEIFMKIIRKSYPQLKQLPLRGRDGRVVWGHWCTEPSSRDVRNITLAAAAHDVGGSPWVWAAGGSACTPG